MFPEKPTNWHEETALNSFLKIWPNSASFSQVQQLIREESPKVILQPVAKSYTKHGLVDALKNFAQLHTFAFFRADNHVVA